VDSFNKAASRSQSAPTADKGLRVVEDVNSGVPVGQIDTGRYLISSATTYSLNKNRPNEDQGGNAIEQDGFVSIYDKNTKSSVDIYGDPHVYTSDGNRAKFQANDLTIELGDGTQVQFEPTAEKNRVARIEKMAVTKGGETVMAWNYQARNDPSANPLDKGVDLTPVMKDDPNIDVTNGFDSTNGTVIKAGPDGSLGTLYTLSGEALHSTKNALPLDDLGGGDQLYGNIPANNENEFPINPPPANAPPPAVASATDSHDKKLFNLT